MQMPQRRFYIDTATYIIGTTTTTTSVIDTAVVELYKHSFSDTPSVHPYVTVPNVINANLSNSSWTNSRSMWTNYASNTNMGKAIAFDNSTSDTSTVTLTLNIASGKKVGIKSFSFYNRVSNSGYRHWKMYINGIEVGDSSLYYPATGGTGNNTVKSTGTVQVKNAVEDITGSITVLLKLYDHDAAYPNGNAQGTFRMDDFILNGYVNDDGGSVGSGGYQYANKGGYRYGFGSMEKSNEVSGEGNHYTAKFGELDPRLGRRWNRDPKPNVSISSYAVFANNPIWHIDIALDTPRPLTTFRLREMATKAGATGTGVNFNRQAGKMFEAVALQSQNLSENKTPFTSTERTQKTGTSTQVIPDGVRSVTVAKSTIGFRWPPIQLEYENYPQSSFFEAKAVNGLISLSSSNYQIQGELDAVKNSPAGKIGRGTMTFVTTANTFIAPDVIKYARDNKINLYQVFAFEETDDQSIRFTPPIPLTNPSQYSRSVNITPLAKFFDFKVPYFLNSTNKAEPASTPDPEIVE